ncbi:IMP cyclohydrolase [Bosea sp. 2RAB26]|uniref:IMP cyclohydrolase n=1 Tax=Bosea sp. 2RAB26 TaxID=3237476 RepID=UPI003F913117
MTEGVSRYVGRIIAVGRTPLGDLVSAYRVSSRSFPNRDAERSGNAIRIVPRANSADAASESPYIAYESLLWTERYVVASNGTQTRPIFERLRAGHTVRDALIGVLSGLDREFDAHDTPRICSVLDLANDTAYLGSITAEALSVTPVHIAPGQATYITTYGSPLAAADRVDPHFTARTAEDACQHVVGGSIFAHLDSPVCSAALHAGKSGLEAAVFNIRDDA